MEEKIKIHCLYDELINPKKLKDHKKNNNSHSHEQVLRLAKILEYQGFRFPIKVSKQTGYITSGHCRKLSAIHLGLKQVPVVYQDYKDMDQEMADLYCDNSIQSWSDFDLGAVNDEIGNFSPDFDLDLLGINGFTLDVSEKEVKQTNVFIKQGACPNCKHVDDLEVFEKEGHDAKEKD